MKTHLGNYSWQEVQELIKDDPVVVLPVGAFEQHGKHLPVKVDEFLVGSVAEESVIKSHKKNIKAVLTPVVWTGYSPHHLDFPGTITIQEETLTNLIIEIVESLVHNKLERILILNGHGGNANILKNVVQVLRYKKNIYTTFASYWDFALKEIAEWRKSETGGIMHACEMETSLMLNRDEQTVQMNKAEDHYLNRSKYLAADLLSGGPISVAASFKELSENGSIGAPTLATKERGEDLFNKITDSVSDFLVEFSKWPKPLTGEKNE